MKNQLNTESIVAAEEQISMIGESLVRELSAEEISEVSGAIWVATLTEYTTVKDQMFI